MSGEASVAVINGKVRIGFDLGLRISLRGHDKSRFADAQVEIEIAGIFENDEDDGDDYKIKFIQEKPLSDRKHI